MARKKKRILFIYNPKAGKSKIRNTLMDIIDIFIKHQYEVVTYPTQCTEDALYAVKERTKGFYDLIVCSGGDGTLDEVVTGMLQCEERIPIGYIPAGSTNDFAHSIGIPSDMIEATEAIVDGDIFHCDVGRFNDDAFVYIAAFGIFTEVSYATDQHLKNVLGHTAYILEGMKSLTSVQSYNIRFESEELCGEGEFIYGMISNSDSVGGFRGITGKNIELSDGKFEVTLIRKPTSLIDLNSLAVSLLTRKMDSDCILTFKTSNLKIHSDEAISWALDGEYGGNHQEVSIKNLRKELMIIVPEESDFEENE